MSNIVLGGHWYDNDDDDDDMRNSPALVSSLSYKKTCRRFQCKFYENIHSKPYFSKLFYMKILIISD